MYDINEVSDDDEENDDLNFPVIGLADFALFNLLLLFVIPIHSSFTIKAWIAFGCIVSVLIGSLCTGYLLHNRHFVFLPALPFSVVAVTAFTIIIDAIIPYSNYGCEDPIEMKEKSSLSLLIFIVEIKEFYGFVIIQMLNSIKV